MLQLVFDVISTVDRAQGLTILVKSDGSKMAWTGLEFDPHSGEWHTCDDGRHIELVDGTIVPRVNSYKHLGSVIRTEMSHELVRDRCVRRCCAVLAELARIGVLSLLQFEQAADAAVSSVIGYYSTAARRGATPIGMVACEQIEAARRRGLAANGHRSYNGSNRRCRRTGRWWKAVPACVIRTRWRARLSLTRSTGRFAARRADPTARPSRRLSRRHACG